MDKEFYTVLGLNPSDGIELSIEDLKKLIRKKQRELHTDRSAEDKVKVRLKIANFHCWQIICLCQVQRINQVNKVLIHEGNKKKYDDALLRVISKEKRRKYDSAQLYWIGTKKPDLKFPMLRQAAAPVEGKQSYLLTSASITHHSLGFDLNGTNPSSLECPSCSGKPQTKTVFVTLEDWRNKKPAIEEEVSV